MAAPAAAETWFTLAIEGDARARVEADCRLATAAGERTVRLAGAPPLTRRFEGTGLGCTLVQTAAGGRLAVTVESGSGNVTRLATAGAGSRSTLRVE
ncbi:MAG: hypothetical protein GVY33_08075 [Alphaproteobacteria bacterium]|nr:hypothetical protein [Alphaproteobacteria bacterium]